MKQVSLFEEKEMFQMDKSSDKLVNALLQFYLWLNDQPEYQEWVTKEKTKAI
jgi:hypothetical protein